MSAFGFDQISEQKRYLRTPGLHINAKFLGLTYDATEQYEFFDIEIETSEGYYFRERTFGPNKEKVFPKDIYQKGVKVGLETKEQAYERVVGEVNNKLYHLGLCFTDKSSLTEGVKKVKDLKGLVQTVSKIIDEVIKTKSSEEPEKTLNFLTIWKNSDSKQKSNLILAERIKWCEAYTEGKEPTIKLTKWQLDNSTVEKYPYNANNDAPQGTSALDSYQDQPAGAVDDLPF